MTRKLAELDYRAGDGITVTLLWDRISDAILVRVTDEREEEDFEVSCAPGEALAVFHHPYAYADARPVQNVSRRRAHTVDR